MSSKLVEAGEIDRRPDYQREDFKKSKIFSLGGELSPRKVFVAYQLFQELLSKTPVLHKGFYSHAALILDDRLYCIGGFDETSETFSVSGEVWKQDAGSHSLTWKQVASLHQKRCKFGADVFYSALVVAGGLNSVFEATASTEIYVEELDEWKVIAPLNQKSYGNALVACGGFLYALGGSDGEKCSSSVQRLDNFKSAWASITPMQTERYRLAAVNCNDEIYAIGGSSSQLFSSSLKSVEKYNSIANKWQYVSEMNHARCNHAACILRDKIYVVGGRGKDGRAVKEIECYDPSTDAWTVVGNTENELWDHALVAL